MSLTKDGFYKQIGGVKGNNDYLLQAGGGAKAWGNASGNIPVSNGTVNINLNADLLDGIHASGLFTQFINAGSQTTRITIGGTTNDLKIDADLLDGVHLNGIFTAFGGGGISSSGNTLTQANHSITIGGVTKTAGSSTANIINSLSVSTLTSNNTTNLTVGITINGEVSGNKTLTDLYARDADKLDGIHASGLFTQFDNAGSQSTRITIGGTTKELNIDADMTDGLHVHGGRNNEANKIVRTDGNGYIQAGYINTNVGTEDGLAWSRVFFEYNNDGYIRKASISRAKTVFFGGQVGSLSVPIYWTGSAFATCIVSFGDANNGEHNANNINDNGIKYYNSNGPSTSLGASTIDGALYSQAYSTSWVAQIAQDYRNGGLYVRGKNNGTWQSWYRVWDNRTTYVSGGKGYIGNTEITQVNNASNADNADKLDGYHFSDLESRYVNVTGDTMTGNLSFSNSASIKNAKNVELTDTLAFSGVINVTSNGSSLLKLSTNGSDNYIKGNSNLYIESTGNGSIDFDSSNAGINYTKATWTENFKSLIINSDKGISLYGNGNHCYFYAGTSGNPYKMEIGSYGVSYIQFGTNGLAKFYGDVEFRNNITVNNTSLFKKDVTMNNNLSVVKTITGKNFVSTATSGQPYATSSTALNNNLNADLLDGIHASGLFTNFGNSGNNITATIGGTTKTFTVNYASNAGNADTLDNYHASGLFTQFINAGSQTTRITIGGTPKDLKIDADTVDSYHATNFLAWGGMQSVGSGSPFSDAVTFFNNLSNLNNGGKMLYNYSGAEYTMLFTRRSDSTAHGSILKWGYPDKYIRIIRMVSGSAQSTDWEKISAGYADSAGNASTATKLQTARTIWGQSFDGTADINGNIYIDTGDNDRFIQFRYNTNNYAGASWRLMSRGSGSGDTNYFDIETGGSNASANTWYRVIRLTMDNRYVGIGTDSPSSKLHISGGLLKITNNSNTVTIGSANSSWCHFENSANIQFYFNKAIHVDGAIWRYNTNYGIANDGRFYALAIYANRSSSSTDGGVSLYGTDFTYSILFRGTGWGGTHGGVTGDWATYLTMSDTTNRGWIFRRGSTNVASIDGNGKLYLGYPNSSANPGVYWNPYVESASDSSDVSAIYQIKSGVAGGTELRITQANDSNDVINICSPAYIYLNSKRAFTINDSWLRINENLGFSSGIYTGSSLVRSDNQLQVGSGGSAFYANSSGNGYFSNTLGIAGTNTGYNLYVNGTSYLSGALTIEGRLNIGGEVSLYNGSSFRAQDSVVHLGETRIYGSLKAQNGGIFGGNLDMDNNDITNIQSMEVYGTARFYNDLKAEQIQPYSDNSGFVGTSTKRFADIYAVNYHGDYFDGTAAYATNAGNASSATKLATARTLWGQSFDGTANITGNMSNVGNITSITNNLYSIGTGINKWKNIYATTFHGDLDGTASYANYAGYLKGPDNRSTNNNPSWYMSNRGSASLYGEFCQTGGANGDYEYRMTMTPWVDNSGQRPVQLAFNNSGMFMRTSASDTAWNAWNTIIHSGNIGSQSVSYASNAGNADTVDGYHANDLLITVDSALSTTSKNPVQNKVITNALAFRKLTNPSDSSKVGLVNSLSIYYNTNIGKGAVIEGEGLARSKIEASGQYSHAEGSRTNASGIYAHAEGEGTKASSSSSHAEGYVTTASGSNSHAEGRTTTASGDYSHAEGNNTTASGSDSHAEGISTTASGNYGSHAEGYTTTASGDYSHAEGSGSEASGDYSHAEGCAEASGQYSHAEGGSTSANGWCSHAEGAYSEADGNSSHAEGYETITNNDAEHACGKHNVSSISSTTFGDAGNTLFSVGNGSDGSHRHNAFEIRQNGDIIISNGDYNLTLDATKLQRLINLLSNN